MKKKRRRNGFTQLSVELVINVLATLYILSINGLVSARLISEELVFDETETLITLILPAIISICFISTLRSFLQILAVDPIDEWVYKSIEWLIIHDFTYEQLNKAMTDYNSNFNATTEKKNYF